MIFSSTSIRLKEMNLIKTNGESFPGKLNNLLNYSSTVINLVFSKLYAAKSILLLIKNAIKILNNSLD